MDVWDTAVQSGGPEGEHEDWEAADSGKDALIVLIDVRKCMFERQDDAGASWFQAVVKLVVRLLKAKVIANDNSMVSVVFFGTHKRSEKQTLDHVYEFQDLGFPSAKRIKDLQILADDDSDVPKMFESMENSEPIAISNSLWHCAVAFSNANLKKKDSQRIWIFTNEDSPTLPDSEERGRMQKQVQNHAELKRSLNLFYITPPGKSAFDLSLFYSCAFRDFSKDDAENKAEDEDASVQPAFPVESADDLMEGSLRKRFRKRRLTTFPLKITNEVSIGVELYPLAVAQKKNSPVALDATTNTPLKTESKWLCQDTGSYLTPDQIKKYFPYGGKRVYFAPDDIVQIKHYDAPGLQLICFKPLSSLPWNANVRGPYFVYPCDGYIEGSSTAFAALLNAMVKKQKYALARIIVRKTSEPRLVALLPQEEVNDELGQVQPSGFNVVFLPYLDDIRDIDVANEEKATNEQVEIAKQLIAKLKLLDVPSFENPELQKHYASIQALALGEENLEFNETKDTTLPDEEGFAAEDVKEAIDSFREACGGDQIDQSNLKRKSTARTPAKKKATVSTPKGKAGAGDDDFTKEHWAELVKTNAIQKKSVPLLKAFLQSHGIRPTGRKADLIEAVQEFVES